jgi:hypothetical protein
MIGLECGANIYYPNQILGRKLIKFVADSRGSELNNRCVRNNERQLSMKQ